MMTIGSLRWLCWLPFVGAETALAGPLAAHEWSRNKLGDGNASLVSHASLCRAGKCWPATWILGGQKCGSTSVWVWLKKKSTYGICGAVIPPEAEDGTRGHEKERPPVSEPSWQQAHSQTRAPSQQKAAASQVQANASSGQTVRLRSGSDRLRPHTIAASARGFLSHRPSEPDPK